jgi:uncharacterized membrane protein
MEKSGKNNQFWPILAHFGSRQRQICGLYYKVGFIFVIFIIWLLILLNVLILTWGDRSYYCLRSSTIIAFCPGLPR